MNGREKFRTLRINPHSRWLARFNASTPVWLILRSVIGPVLAVCGIVISFHCFKEMS
jgi:hypothetical protein